MIPEPPRRLKVATWNAFISNPERNHLLAFIRQVDADVFAFQELTLANVLLLKDLTGYQTWFVEDYQDQGVRTWLGIVTRIPAWHHNVCTHNPTRRTSPSIIGKLNRWVENIQSQSIVFGLERRLRLINIHLSAAASPTRRKEELAAIADGHFHEGEHLILCGDFNSAARLWTNLAAGLFLGFEPCDFFRNEIKSLNAFAATHGLSSCLSGVVTYPRFDLQLDHIFVRDLNCRHAKIVSENFGSDHLSVTAELELAP
jgi:endonuclease/exonuclease/phosphatase family metal-dependent hydrolase